MCFDSSMAWKNSANAALHRLTGFMLTRETPEQRQAAIRHAAAVARRRTTQQQARPQAKRVAREARRRIEKETRREVLADRRRRLLASFDDDLRGTVDRVQHRTMTSPEKLAALIEATRYVERAQIPGAVVECGVWRGGSMEAVALTLLALGQTDRELHLFDTFEGMPAPSEHDTRTIDEDQVSAEQLLASADKDSRMWAVAGLDEVKQAMAGTGYPEARVHFHPGLVEDTTPGQAPDTIAILRLDTDWYASTKHELEHLYQRLSPGGVLILDDYGDWEGARKATDEWINETGEPVFLVPMGSGRIAVKPPSPGSARMQEQPGSTLS
jgi:hypothetical protein